MYELRNQRKMNSCIWACVRKRIGILLFVVFKSLDPFSSITHTPEWEGVIVKVASSNSQCTGPTLLRTTSANTFVVRSTRRLRATRELLQKPEILAKADYAKTINGKAAICLLRLLDYSQSLIRA